MRPYVELPEQKRVFIPIYFAFSATGGKIEYARNSTMANIIRHCIASALFEVGMRQVRLRKILSCNDLLLMLLQLV